MNICVPPGGIRSGLFDERFTVMFAKVKEIEERYNALEADLSDPEVVRNQKAYQTYAKEHSMLTPIITAFRKHQSLQDEILENQSLLDDPDSEIRQLAREELDN